MSPLKQLKQVSPGSTLLPGSVEKAAAEQTYRNLAGNLPPSDNLAGSPPVNAGTPVTPPLANAELNMQVNPGAVPPDQMNPASPVAQTDVMGRPYTRTDTEKKVNENTYIDYAMEYGATPTKKEARKYKRKVRKGKI